MAVQKALRRIMFMVGAGTISRFGARLACWMGREETLNALLPLFRTARRVAGVIFGDDLTIRTQSKNAANNGKDVDGIRTPQG